MTLMATNELQVILLAPDGGRRAVEEVLTLSQSSGEPFSDTRQRALAQLSRAILQDTTLRADPASVAVGYWLRKSNIERLAADFERRKEAAANTVLVPVGRVFHVAPGNVDTVFLYSWVLSYLCGNQNIVRVSGERSEILNRLLAVLCSLMKEDAELAGGNRFMTYEHDEAINEALSQWATHRVLWGGDESVSRLRAVPLSPHASERTFGSKFSYCVLSADAYLDASPRDVSQLASGFYNDIFWFDQMACSSPHLFIWVGSAQRTEQALDRFHTVLATEIERRGHRGASSNAVHRLNYLFNLACETDLLANLAQREFLSVRLADGEVWRKEICGAGFLVHVRADDLPQVAQFAGQQDQTVTHFGFSRDELFDLARVVGARGVDRLVPVGEALAFDTTWDGYDLIGDFVRHVSVRMSST
jgi:hypothetical protein